MSASPPRPVAGADTSLPFKAFISYSTDPDYKLSQRVESFIETFHKLKTPPGITLKPVQVCRDGSDFSIQNAKRDATGSPDGVVERLIETYLAQSEYLVVLCSTHTPRSRFVEFEINWFLKHRDWDHILLAVTEGDNPAANPVEVFPAAVIENGLHTKPFYDLRGFRTREAAHWTKVRDSEEECANLAAFLHDGGTSGRLLPIWQREAVRKARRQRLVFAGTTIVFAAVAGIALWQRTVAVKARERTERALAASQARQLVIFAETNIETDPQLTLLLSIEAARLAGRSGDGIDAVESILRRAVLATPLRLGADIEGIECFAIRPDGRSLAIGTQHAGVIELSLSDGSVLRRYEAPGWIDSVAWNQGDDLLAVASRDQNVSIFDGRDGHLVERRPFEFAPQSVHWRAKTHQLAIGFANANASRTKVYDVDTKKELLDVVGMRAAWSPDGRLLATGGGDGSVHIYDDGGRELAAMPGHSRYVAKIVWNPNGRLIATASVDDHVMVWDAQEHRRVADLENEFALSAAWSVDGRLLASGAGSQFVKVWDTATYHQLFELTHSQTLTGAAVAGSGATGYVLEVAWTPDGGTFVASDRNGGVLAFPAAIVEARTPEDWLATAKKMVRRELTPDEIVRFGLSSASTPR